MPTPAAGFFSVSLAVEPQQVVLGEAEAADGRLAFYAAAWAMPVVSVQPEGQLLGASLRGGVGLGIGPFAERGLNEALGLAVGFRCVGLGADVFEPAIAAGVAEVRRVLVEGQAPMVWLPPWA